MKNILLAAFTIALTMNGFSQTVDVIKATKEKGVIGITYKLNGVTGVSFVYIFIDGQQREELSITDAECTYTTKTLHSNGSFYFVFESDTKNTTTATYQLKIE